MKKKIVIFDLDGTLLNTLKGLTNSTNFALQKLGFPERTECEIKNFVGNGVSKLIERAIPNGIKNPNFEKCLSLFKQHYSLNMFENTEPYEGVVSMLAKIRNNGIKIAVVSNKFDSAVKDLCKVYFPNLADISVGENESLGIKKKPAPDSVIAILQQFKIKNENAIYVGDSEVDIQTAKNAEIECISVSWGFKSREFLIKNGAKNIIDCPDEIFKYL